MNNVKKSSLEEDPTASQLNSSTEKKNCCLSIHATMSSPLSPIYKLMPTQSCSFSPFAICRLHPLPIQFYLASFGFGEEEDTTQYHHHGLVEAGFFRRAGMNDESFVC